MNLGLNYGGGSVASANQGLSPLNYGLGAAELALAGGINGLVDIGAGFASAVALPFVGLNRAVGVQQAISSVLGYELKTAGALDIGNRLAFIGEGVEALRGISEERFGLGATAVGFGVVDAGAQIGTLLLGARPLLSAAKRGSGSEVAANSVDELVDANTLLRTHSLEGKRSIQRVEEIASDMRLNGYNGPAIDVVEANGNKYIVDGHHRAAAARQAGIPVKINIVDDIFNHPSSYQSIDEVIQSAETVGFDRLVPRKR